MSPNPLLELHNISVTYGVGDARRRPVVDWSFSMNAGDLVVVLGGSGTGKSTLLDVIAGFIRPSMIGVEPQASAWLAPRSSNVRMTGTVLIDGADVTSLEPRERRIGLVMQRFNLYPHMSVRKNLEFPLRMRGMNRAERKRKAEESAQLFEITEHLKKSPDDLSVGEQQRAAIAKMILAEPRIALFDEAFSNLNWELRDYLFQNVIKRFISDSDKGVIFVTHNLLDAIEANKIVYLKREKGDDRTLIKTFPSTTANAWQEFEAFLTASSELYSQHRDRYSRVFSRNMKATSSVFGHTLYSPLEVLEDLQLEEPLKRTFLEICRAVGIADDDAMRLSSELWKQHNVSLGEFENELQSLVNSIVSPHQLRSALEQRSQIIAGQVRPFIVGNSLADIGCGDGMVAWHLRDCAKKIILADVHLYLDDRIQFPFYSYSEGEPIPFSDIMDTTLLLTVLHHSENPVRLLHDTHRVTRRRAIVIESVFDVDRKPEHPVSILRKLDRERQFKYQTFLDWLYNRVFHDGVPVPFNFNTPTDWVRIFNETGWQVEHKMDLGIDIPIVPEHHFLYVLRPQRPTSI